MNVAVPSGSSSVAGAGADIFQNEAALIKALSLVRQAPLPSSAKDAIRDLFLNYVGTGDEREREALKAAITAELAKYPPLAALLPQKATEAASIEPAAAGNDRPIGRTRPAPSFAAISPKATAAVPPPTPTPASPEAIPDIPPPEMATPPATPEPTPPVAPVEETPPAPVAEAVPTPAAPTPPVAAEAPTPAYTSGRGRIDEIKRDINSRVGNPVNLITADETIGREYMSALLDAMKQTASGGGVEKLTRLEPAYRAALQLIESKGLGKKDTNQTMTATPAATPPAPEPIAPTPPPAESTPAPAPLAAAVIPEPVLPPPIPSAAPTTPAVTTGLYHQPVDGVDASQAIPDRKPRLGLASLTSKLFKADEHEPASTETPAPASQAASERAVRKVSVRTDVPAAAASDAKLQPLQATAAALPEKMAALKAEANRRDEAAKRPITNLDDPQIDAGLRQLLSEWTLFKRSGFLGTGPAGIDHPLYKQLAPLPMAAVISGRFEGSTPEIKRSLGDYMNGWRYEQGILHEMGETFEHYLRRVIRQILEMKRMSIKI